MPLYTPQLNKELESLVEANIATVIDVKGQVKKMNGALFVVGLSWGVASISMCCGDHCVDDSVLRAVSVTNLPRSANRLSSLGREVHG